MRVFCPTCMKAVAGDDIDLAHGVAVCRPCAELIALPASVPLAKPADLRCREFRDGASTSFVLTPSRLTGLALAAFALFWDGFLVSWYAGVLGQPSLHMMALLFPLLHVGAGAFITWAALRSLFNTTRISLGHDGLRVVEGPVPTPGGIHEVTANIARFEAGQRRRGWAGSFGRRPTEPVATVLVTTRDERSIPLALQLDCDDHARWLAAQLNDALAAASAPGEPLTYRG